MRKVYIGVDPGKGGGIAVMVEGNAPELYNMSDTIGDMLELFRQIASIDGEKVCYSEKVGGHRPGNSAVATATFARHCGNLEMGLLAAGIPTTLVAPQKWMKAMGSLSKEKGKRKNQIKDAMQRKYPGLKITLKTSDALAIMDYGIGQVSSLPG